MTNETIQIDLLRVHSWEAAFKDDDVLRGKLMTSILDAISGMCNMRLQEVARFIDIVQNDKGCITPAEEFITDLVGLHYRRECEGLTPEDAEEELQKFRDDFKDAVEVAKRFNRTYMATVLGLNESEKKEG